MSTGSWVPAILSALSERPKGEPARRNAIKELREIVRQEDAIERRIDLEQWINTWIERYSVDITTPDMELMMAAGNREALERYTSNRFEQAIRILGREAAMLAAEALIGGPLVTDAARRDRLTMQFILRDPKSHQATASRSLQANEAPPSESARGNPQGQEAGK